MEPNMKVSDRAYGFFNTDDTKDNGAIFTARKPWLSKIPKYEATSSQISFSELKVQSWKLKKHKYPEKLALQLFIILH